jgi:alpha/beta superfamily hydrolase
VKPLHRLEVHGHAGRIEALWQAPAAAPEGIAVIAHPHPLHGGTMDNKVVQTLARSFVELGLAAVRFNFRGVGGSAGEWDEGRGETEDLLAVAHAARESLGHLPLTLAGFSFGGYIAARAARRLHPRKLVLIAPAVKRFPVPEVAPETLVVHGELDDVVPLQDLFDWARPQALPVVVIPGGEHFFHGRLHLLKNIVLERCRS